MKKWFEPLSSAWVGVATHKLRSFLTILGIVIGVAAVIALMSVGKGAEAAIVSNIQRLGSDLVFVRPGASFFGGVRGAAGSVGTLTMQDADAIRQQIPYVARVAPTYSSSLQIIAGSKNMRSSVTGITPEYQETFNLKIAQGTPITEYEYQEGLNVVLLGSQAKTTLFSTNDPIGQQIRLGQNIATVIGVLESKGTSFGMGPSDDSVLIPLTALQKIVAQPKTVRGDRVVSMVAIAVTDQKQSSYVADEITSLLRYRHNLSATADNDFTVTSVEELASTLSEAMGTMTLLLGAIAAISLLVGGIGVMNIMLVSVIERTREIGIRKALGAKERDIWGQFLIEAAFLTFAGGVVGVIIGWVVSTVISRMGLMTTLVSADIVILAVSVSVGIGLFFGFYPAWQASRLNPIEALRSE